MNTYLALDFIKHFKKIIKHNSELKEKIKSKLELFKTNPLHPSLRLHKLKGKKIDLWSISIELDLRIIFVYLNDGVLLTDIGKHDDFYFS
jgi:addiction module RelE/StbE family toxin